MMFTFVAPSSPLPSFPSKEDSLDSSAGGKGSSKGKEKEKEGIRERTPPPVIPITERLMKMMLNFRGRGKISFFGIFYEIGFKFRNISASVKLFRTLFFLNSENLFFFQLTPWQSQQQK
jgi:hypothetical protein